MRFISKIPVINLDSTEIEDIISWGIENRTEPSKNLENWTRVESAMTEMAKPSKFLSLFLKIPDMEVSFTEVEGTNSWGIKN
jgi:hypothetical protein